MVTEKQREYQKKWRANNPEKALGYQRKYYIKNREKRRKYSREYYIENREKWQEYKREWTINNPEKMREWQLEYHFGSVERYDEAMLEYDGWCAFGCGKTGQTKAELVHHLDGKNIHNSPEEDVDNSLKNLLPLCKPCHTRLHRKKDEQ